MVKAEISHCLASHQTLQQMRSDSANNESLFPMTGNAVRLAFEHLRIPCWNAQFSFS
jgi:hypothetical protein